MKPHYLLPLFLLTACDLAPDLSVPTDRVPQGWLKTPVAAPSATASRWSDFNSAELNQLIATALANNTDISAALARIEQSRAAAKISGAGLYPQADLSGSAGRTRTDAGTVRTVDNVGTTLSLSYELDLWQRNRNLADSALWQLRATQYDKDALTILISSEVARLYSGVLAFESRMEVAKKNLANAKDVLRITELRHKEGAISGLEEAQQRTSVQNTEASIAALQNQSELFYNQLALVIGVAPANLHLQNDRALANLTLRELSLSTPWELLQRRPDIAAAEARLRAANIDIGVARANALPSLSLALNGGISGNPSTTLVGLAASFFAPIFQGGALEGAIERSEAARNEQVAQYQSTLLVAFREVEDALSNYEAAQKRRESLAVAATEARKAETIARTQFKEGSTDFTTFIATQNTVLQAEDSYLSAIQAQLAARIDLMRALGEGADIPPVK